MKILKFVTFLIFLFLLFGFLSCKSSFHYKRILKKDPAFFNIDTTTIKTVIEIPPINTAIDCDLISTTPTVLRLPAVSKTKTDTVTITLYRDQSGLINTTVDCPDSETIIQKIPEPYPVYVKPTIWQVSRLAAIAVIIILGSLFVFSKLK